MIKSRKTTQLESGFIWGYIKAGLQGAEVFGKALSYDSSEFGVITQKEIIQILEHVFGAKSKKSHGARKLDFDISKLQRLGKVYDLAIKVEVVRDGDDSFEHNRGSDWTDWTDVGLDKHLVDELPIIKIEENDPKDTNSHNNTVSYNNDITTIEPQDNPVIPVHPPEVPHATPKTEAPLALD